MALNANASCRLAVLRVYLLLPLERAKPSLLDSVRSFYENKYHKSFYFMAPETRGEERTRAFALRPSQVSEAKSDRVLTFSD